MPSQLDGALDRGGKWKFFRPIDELEQPRIQGIGRIEGETRNQLRHRAGGTRDNAVRACPQSPGGGPVVAVEYRERAGSPEFQQLFEKRPVAARILYAGEAAGVDQSAHEFQFKFRGRLRPIVYQDWHGVPGFAGEL